MIRLDDWYYLAASSFEWLPTIPIHGSRDLATWQYAGSSVDTAVPGSSLLAVPDSRWRVGARAQPLRRALLGRALDRPLRGTRHFDLETYLCTAPDVSGPWSRPVRLPGHGFDPSLLHHEGDDYLLNLQTTHA